MKTRKFTQHTVYNPATLPEPYAQVLVRLADEAGRAVSGLSQAEAEELIRYDDRRARLPAPSVTTVLATMLIASAEDRRTAQGHLDKLCHAALAVAKDAARGDGGATLNFENNETRALAHFAIMSLANVCQQEDTDLADMTERQLGLRLARAFLPSVAPGKPSHANNGGGWRIGPRAKEKILAKFCEKAEALLPKTWRDHGNRIGERTLKRATKEAFEAAYQAHYGRRPTVDANDKDNRRRMREIVGLTLPWTTCVDVLYQVRDRARGETR